MWVVGRDQEMDKVGVHVLEHNQNVPEEGLRLPAKYQRYRKDYSTILAG